MNDDGLTLSEQITRAEDEYFSRFTGGRSVPGQARELAEMCDHIARLHDDAAEHFRQRAAYLYARKS